MPDEIRRVRTQAERDDDGLAWRVVADSRPGYATYPQTHPGSPSWWRRDAPDARLLYFGPAYGDKAGPGTSVEAVGPTPVDGETCTKWCGFCHLGNSEHEPPAEQPPPGVVPPISFGFIADPPPPRRRWWHRYTRRNP